MLVLTRGKHETIIVGEGDNAIQIAFLGMSKDDPTQARIGVNAPRDVLIIREELLRKAKKDEPDAQ